MHPCRIAFFCGTGAAAYMILGGTVPCRATGAAAYLGWSGATCPYHLGCATASQITRRQQRDTAAAAYIGQVLPICDLGCSGRS